MRTLIVLAVSVMLLAIGFGIKVKAATPREVSIFLPDAENDISQLTSLEGTLGIKFNSVKWYQDWTDSFDSGIATSIHNHGAIPELTWQPQDVSGKGISNADVVNGTYDTYLATTATAVKTLGFPIRVNLAPEMNGDWTPWAINKNGNTPANHILFWQHVVQLFRNQGATNVSWIWSPNILDGGLTTTYSDIYPGDTWVDFVGLDGYNWGTSSAGHTWQSFRQVFEPSYTDLTRVSQKPVLLMETASTELGGNKSVWITAMFQDLPVVFPRIQGFTWFDENKESDWRINSSPASEQSFSVGAKVYQTSMVIPIPPTTGTSGTTSPTHSKKKTTTVSKITVAASGLPTVTQQDTINTTSTVDDSQISTPPVDTSLTMPTPQVSPKALNKNTPHSHRRKWREYISLAKQKIIAFLSQPLQYLFA